LKNYNVQLLQKIKNIENFSASLWLEQMRIDSIDSEAVNVSFPNNYIANFVEKNMSSVVYELISDISGKNNFKINYLTKDPVDSVKNIIIETSATNKVIKKQRSKKTGLNSRYTFDRYITGAHNDMASTVAHLIVDDLDSTKVDYNPFLIYSKTGLGKTHLVQSIYFDLKKKGVKSVYLTSERFLEMFIESVKNKTKGSNSFISNFKDIQVIIIDDIQFFEKKAGTQDMFKKLFLHMINNNKSIILTLDRPVEKLNIITEGLINDLSKGISLEITYPDFLTRIEIIKAKFLQNHQLKKIPDNLLAFIAAKYDNVNVRVLEGVVNKVSFAYKHLGYSLESDKIQQFVNPTVTGEIFVKSSHLNIKKIVNEVANYFGVKLFELQGKSKKKDIVLPRQVSIFLIKELLDQSYETIGEFFNRTAVASKYSYSSIEKRIDNGDNVLLNHISDIRSLI